MKANLLDQIKLLSLLLIIFSAIEFKAQECTNREIFTTSCGTIFDLCKDYETTDINQSVDINISFNDNLGIFNACDLQLTSTTTANGGNLEKLGPEDNCAIRYTPALDFVGEDCFTYELFTRDTCNLPMDYCTGDDGKIWTILSDYFGPDNVDVYVRQKKGNSPYFDFVLNLQNGDDFFIDGTGLGNEQSEWVFDFFNAGDGPNGQVINSIQVHTSCSEEIFGVNFGWFRPISGCITNPNTQTTACSNPLNTIDITSFQAEIEVCITVVPPPPPPLAIEFGSISGRAQGESNIISWSILSVEGEKELRLERSADGKSFETLVSFKDLEAGNFNTLDDNPISELTYYRFTSISFNGELTITHSIAIENKQLSEGVNIYPIPATEEININANKVIYKVDLFNLAGKRIIAVNPQEREARIIIDSDIQAGIYFIRTTLEDGSMKTKRIHILR